LGISPDAPVVGIVGDLIPLKGQDTLLEAARLLPPAMASAVRLLVLGVARHGDGESHAYAAQLRAMADRNPAGDADKLRPSVLFAGRCDDLPAVLNAMDLLVVASDRETGPLVLLYAFASGVPVVSTPVGRAPELVQAGVTGELFPIGDAATLADRLAVLLDDSHHLRCMGQTARRLAEEQLSLAVFHTRIRGVIERTLEEI
jgi:glycosyltransferase involved in cell wall biosynthesis